MVLNILYKGKKKVNYNNKHNMLYLGGRFETIFTVMNKNYLDSRKHCGAQFYTSI